MKLPLPKMIPGMSWGSHKVIFLAWAYSVAGLTVWYNIRKQQKQKVHEEYVAYYRFSGHYKHPWQNKNQKYNDPKGIEATKGIDYVKMVSAPKGTLLY